ncbi:MAG: FkbM family methyltransferase [bacterium]|nr:FkbM family methyltransferase [bacterium]
MTKTQKIDTRISLHHIGGRGGTRAFPYIPGIEKDIVNVLYDADPDCAEQIKERNESKESELHVLPYCLGETNKTANFTINYDPFTSSLYKLNPEYGDFYQFYQDHDYILGETFKPMEQRTVETVTLDHLFQKGCVKVPPPDFLSIDTQGAEYDILTGAVETLKNNTLALQLEVEFHAIYKDQKLFGDIVKFLEKQGFYFANFLDIYGFSPYRAPLGLRGDGFHTFGEALFLRKISHLQEHTKNNTQLYLKLHKLAFISLAFNQIEYALKALAALGRLHGLCGGYDGAGNDSAVDRDSVSTADTGDMRIDMDVRLYIRLLRDLEREVGEAPRFFPHTFAGKYTFQESRSRFDSQEIPYEVKGTEKKKDLQEIPGTILTKDYTAVEKLLINYRMQPQAEKIREIRLNQAAILKGEGKKEPYVELLELKKHTQLVTIRFDLLNHWLEKRSAGRNIGDYLRNKNVKTIGIYGLGTFAERLMEEVNPSQTGANDIKIACIVDGRRELQGGRYDGIPVINDYLIRKYMEVELIIVTPFHAFEVIRKKIEENLTHHNPGVIGIDEIINEF